MSPTDPPAGCPDRVELENLAAGRPVDPAVAEHARACPACSKALAEIREREAFLRDFVNMGAPAGPDEGDLRTASIGAGKPGAVLAARDGRGQSIGPYRLVEVLGEGGFGEVWLAERQQPFHQRVALKLIKLGMDSAAVIARFEQERQALAMMDHPNIARVLDGGVAPRQGWGSGRPYFVMEYVDGESITDYCDRRRLGTRDRLTLFLHVCEAVEHAHMKGIIHRDIKPSNVLVTESDGHGVPKIIDFGISKAIGGGLTEKTIFTEQGQFIGTPEYMSPEQMDLGHRDIDTRTDVYSLGVLLYELLAGERPFDIKRLRSAGFEEIRRIIREVDPPKPSARLTTMNDPDAGVIAKSRRTSRHTLARELRRELDWIPLMAMRKDRRHRYSSPAELARDVRNYLDGRALIAGPESAVYRIRKILRRHRAAFTAAGIALAGLVLGLVLALRALDRESIARRNEAEHRRLAEDSLSFLEDVLGSANPLLEVKDRPRTPEQLLAWMLKSLQGGRLKDQPAAEARLRRVVGVGFVGLGNAADGVAQLQIAVRLQRSVPRPDAAMLAETEIRLADAMISAGQPADARLLAREAAARRLAEGGPDDQLAARALTVAANAAVRIADFDQAEQLYRQALAIHRRAAPGSEYMGETLAGLAHALIELKRLDEAEPFSREAIETLSPLLGDSHPAVVAVRERQARTALERGELEKARALIDTALGAAMQLGDDISGVASILLLKTALDMRTGDYQEAQASAERSLEIRQGLRGGDPAEIAESMGWLARVKRARGDAAGAGQLFQRAIAILRPMGEDAEYMRVPLLLAAASCRRTTQEFESADALLAELEGLVRKGVEGTSAMLGAVLSDRASVFLSLAKPVEASAAANEALQDPAIAPLAKAQALDVIARVRMDGGDPAGAEKLFREAIDLYDHSPSYPPLYAAVARARLGRCLDLSGRSAEAVALLTAAAEAIGKDPSASKSHRNRTWGWLADALASAGRTDDAQRWRGKVDSDR